MSKGWQLTRILCLFGLFALFYQGLWGDPHHIPTVLIETDAPNFEGPDVETGQTISLDQFKGKVVLLNFWASWCYECKVEHESILRLHQLFKDNPEFVMLGVNYQDLPSARRRRQRHQEQTPQKTRLESPREALGQFLRATDAYVQRSATQGAHSHIQHEPLGLVDPADHVPPRRGE
jgi:cytochrome c biogenesis protein CcmG/thiol:disulfide interchange protein DsbE